MSKRFIIALDSSTMEQNEALRDYFNKEGIGWWTWIKDFWLVDAYAELRASDIRDVLGKTHPKITNLVIELNKDGDTWAGYGPNTEESDMFKWIEKYWKKN